MKSPITPAQIKKVHALKNALGLDDDTYRQVLRSSLQASSSKDLTAGQAEQLIEDLEGKAVAAGVWERKPYSQGYKHLSGRPGMATGRQLRMIQGIWAEVSRQRDPQRRARALRSFLEKIAKVTDLRFLDSEGASKVINALKTMQERKAGGASSEPSDFEGKRSL